MTSSIIPNDDEEHAVVGVVPTSIGALLAEEWTIHPYSALPSFLEMVWMQEADRSIHQALETGMQYALERLERRSLPTNNAISSNNDPQQANGWRVVTAWLTRAQQSSLRRIRAWLRRYPHETVALAVYLLERNCLLKNHATVAESMYGGRRVQRQTSHQYDKQNTSRSTTTTTQLQPLAPTGMTRLALFKALIPYVRKKLNLWWASQQQQQQQQTQSRPRNSNSLETNTRTKIRRLLAFLYPFLRASLQGADWWCHWRFLMGSSFHFDAVSALLGQIVRRSTLEDQTKPVHSDITATPVHSDTAATVKDSNLQIPSSSMWQRLLTSGVAAAVAVSWLTWWRAQWERLVQQQALSLSSRGTTIPPPPPRFQFARGMSQGRSNECPLCHRQPQHVPTCCIRTGHVYCGDCISKHVQQHETCPLSGKPCRLEELVRLYEPHLENEDPTNVIGGVNR